MCNSRSLLTEILSEDWRDVLALYEFVNFVVGNRETEILASLVQEVLDDALAVNRLSELLRSVVVEILTHHGLVEL